MKILGLDSSGAVAGVALLEDGVMKAEYNINYKKTHSQILMPMLDELVRMTECELCEIDAIAIAAGPGSFTGLRIGAATAKGLGLALEKPLISVPTCHALAYNMWGTDKLVCPILDARRSQVYTGFYEFVDGELVVISDQDVLSIDDVIQKIDELGRETIFVGDGIPVYRDRIDEKLQTKHLYAPAHMNRQTAAALAALAQKYYEKNELVCADDFAPVYLRKSQAEREREERMKNV